MVAIIIIKINFKAIIHTNLTTIFKYLYYFKFNLNYYQYNLFNFFLYYYFYYFVNLIHFIKKVDIIITFKVNFLKYLNFNFNFLF